MTSTKLPLCKTFSKLTKVSPGRVQGEEGVVPYFAFQPYRFIGLNASPDGFKSHFTSIMDTPPNICEPLFHVVWIGGLEVNLEEVGLGQGLQASA